MITFDHLSAFCPEGGQDILSSIAPVLDSLGASYGVTTLPH